MPSPAPRSSKKTAQKLAVIGGRLRAFRKTIGISAIVAAEAAGMSRETLHRIERGEPSVTMGAYMSAVSALGLDLELTGVAEPRTRKKTHSLLPKSVAVTDYPQLRRLAWQLGDVTSLSPQEAFSIYERNWRHVDKTAMTDKERTLLHLLAEAFGAERLLV